MRKVISQILVLSALLSYSVGFAEDEVLQNSEPSLEIFSVSGEDIAYGETLYATVSGQAASVLWQRTDGKVTVDLGESTEYVVTEADMGYSIQVSAGDDVSEPVEISSYYKNADGTDKSYATNATYTMNRRYSNPDRKFSVKGSGKEFVLADTFNNEESKYFIVADNGYGPYTYAANGTVSAEVTKDGITETVYQTPVWDPEKVNETTENKNKFFAYWINSKSDGGFLASENTSGLPQKMVDYINFDHVWRTEGTPNWSTCSTPKESWKSYTFSAGVTIPSYSEISYYENVGFSTKDIDESGLSSAKRKIWSRTPVDTNKGAGGVGDRDRWALNFYVSYDTSDTRVRTNHTVSDNLYVRPVFYLKDGFFANVPVDLSTAGADVIEEIKKQDAVDLFNIYTAQEIVDVLGLEPPEGYIFLSDIKINVKGEGEPEYGKTLVPEFTYGENNKYPLKDYKIEWLSGEDTVSDATDEYVVTEADCGKTIRFKIMVTDENENVVTAESESVSIPALYNSPVFPNFATSGIKDSKEENVFSIDGREFTLVDTFDNKKSTFYVVANDSYGNYNMTTVNMDKSDDASIISWLNNAFLKDGNGENRLPDGISDFIDYDHIWLCEEADASPSGQIEYTFRAGVTIPSVSELVRYKDILGYAEPEATYWTRTVPDWKNASKPEAEYLFTIQGLKTVDSLKVSHWELPSGTAVRPQFYLKEDFFKNVKIDMETAGEYVIEQMSDRYRIEDLTHLYDAEVLESKGFLHSFELDVEFLSGGVTIDSLSGVKALEAKIDLKSNTEEAVSGLLIFSLYDEDMSTKAIAFKRITADGNSDASVTMTLSDLEGVTDGANAKVMFWNNAFDMEVLNAHHSFK